MDAERLTGPVAGDAFGEALRTLSDGNDATIVIERDDGLVEVDTTPYLGDAEDSETWPWLRSRLGHRVLDVGAGAGRAALPLQRAGLDVVALDVSAAAVDVCRRRGVRETFVGSVEQLAADQPQPFDSFLCFGNNLGLLASPKAATTFFDALRSMSGEGSRLLGTMLDPYATDDPLHRGYHASNRAAGRPAGQVRVRARYQRLATAWFDLLWLSVDELSALAQTSGWELTDVRGGPIYCAELRPT